MRNLLPSALINLSRQGGKLLRRARLKIASHKGSAAYWTSHMVANDDWLDAKDSLDHFLWRNSQYPGYIELMPVQEAEQLTVMDYGCGPGNDLVGFQEFSKPTRLIGVDVSKTALAVARRRLELHGGENVELISIGEDSNRIPLPDSTVDLAHSSGVLHHVKHIDLAINEIRRGIKPGDKLQVILYTCYSLWLHLYTAYIHKIEIGA